MYFYRYVRLLYGVKYLLIFGASLLCACASQKYTSRSAVLADSTDRPILVEGYRHSDYGYIPENPVRVGGMISGVGDSREYAFLDLLTGPFGEKVSYERIGSCCAYESEAIPTGPVLLDQFEVTWKASLDTVTLYFNKYETDTVYIPMGFNLKPRK